MQGRRNVVEMSVEHEARRSRTEVADDIAQLVHCDVVEAECDELRRDERGCFPLLAGQARGGDELLRERDEVTFGRAHQYIHRPIRRS